MTARLTKLQPRARSPSQKKGDESYAKATTGLSIDANRITENATVKAQSGTPKLINSLTDLSKQAKLLPSTKRSLLQISAKMCDPLGLQSPFTTHCKNVERADWDDQLTKEHLKKWNSLIADLTTLNLVCVPRRYISSKASHLKSAELHCFSHASEGHAQLPFTFAPFTRMGVLMSIGSHPRRKSHR